MLSRRINRRLAVKPPTIMQGLLRLREEVKKLKSFDVSKIPSVDHAAAASLAGDSESILHDFRMRVGDMMLDQRRFDIGPQGALQRGKGDEED
jgi:hypothetical protein